MIGLLASLYHSLSLSLSYSKVTKSMTKHIPVVTAAPPGVVTAAPRRECKFPQASTVKHQIFFCSQFILVLLYYTMTDINPIATTEEVQENFIDVCKQFIFQICCWPFFTPCIINYLQTGSLLHRFDWWAYKVVCQVTSWLRASSSVVSRRHIFLSLITNNNHNDL